MNIVLASDNNFVQHCAVTIVSILKNNCDVTLYLLTDNLSIENEYMLLTLTQLNDGKLIVVKVPDNILDKLPMPKGLFLHISVATYYRLFISELLPSHIDKVIYLDCDIVVRHSLEELWNTNLMDYAIGAVYQYNEWSDNENSWDRLHIERKHGYFNAGVLLINLRYWRKFNIQERFMNFIEENFTVIRSHDQDVLNAVLSQSTFPLEYRWNLLPWLFDDYSAWTFPYDILLANVKKDIGDPYIVHFVNTPKPWQSGCTNPFRSEYYKYLEYTPWKDFRPSFEFRSWIYYRISHPVMVYMGKIKRFIFG